ncbi:hypothetical protein Tco_0635693 [Tanacetum coccineum]
MSMSVRKSQVHKMVKRSQDDDKRLCLVDDFKEAQVYIQVKLERNNLKPKEACKEDEDDVLGSSMEVKVRCKGNKVLNKGLEVGSKD